MDIAPPVSLNPLEADFTSEKVPRTWLPAGNATRSPTRIGSFRVATTWSPTTAVAEVTSAPKARFRVVPAGIVMVTVDGAAGAGWAFRSSGIALERDGFEGAGAGGG